MQDIGSPFRSSRKLRQMVICALVFVGMAVPFKVMVLIEGLTEVRPVNAVPIVAGLLFGPAGAWGCAIGNLIADLFGTFSPASLLGFIANFIAAWLPYRLWHLFAWGERPHVKSGRNLGKYIALAAVSALATAIVLACGLDMAFGIWLPQVFWIVLLNNCGWSLLLGLPVFIVLTSTASKVEITLPISGASDRGERRNLCRRRSLLYALILSEIALLLLIAWGGQMSVSWLMTGVGAIFMASLLGLAILN